MKSWYCVFEFWNGGGAIINFNLSYWDQNRQLHIQFLVVWQQFLQIYRYLNIWWLALSFCHLPIGNSISNIQWLSHFLQQCFFSTIISWEIGLSPDWSRPRPCIAHIRILMLGRGDDSLLCLLCKRFFVCEQGSQPHTKQFTNAISHLT